MSTRPASSRQIMLSNQRRPIKVYLYYGNAGSPSGELGGYFSRRTFSAISCRCRMFCSSKNALSFMACQFFGRIQVEFGVTRLCYPPTHLSSAHACSRHNTGSVGWPRCTSRSTRKLEDFSDPGVCSFLLVKLTTLAHNSANTSIA